MHVLKLKKWQKTSVKYQILLGKTKLSYIISDKQVDTVRQANEKNEVTILHTIIMVKTKISFSYDKPQIPMQKNFQV